MLANVVIGGLVAVLGVQHELLDVLVHRLLAARGLLAISELTTIARAATDLEAASAALREHELHRIDVAEAAASVLDLPPTSTLRRLARSAPEPLASVLLDDAVVLASRLADIDGAAADLRLLSALGIVDAERDRSPYDHERWTGNRAAVGQRALHLAAADLPLPRLRRFCA